MIKLKVRNIGVILIKDEQLGQNILRQFQEGQLPTVVDIEDKSFLSRLIEGVEREKPKEKLLSQYSDEELRALAQPFADQAKKAKFIPQKDYSNNEIYPYHSNFLLHVFYTKGCISNENETQTYRVKMNYNSSGEECISDFLELDTGYQALVELNNRHPERYGKFYHSLSLKSLTK